MPVKSTSFTAPTDYNLESQELDRRRELAQALMAEGRRPLQTYNAGMFQKAPHWAEAFGRLGQQLVGAQQEGEAIRDKQALAQRAQADFGSWMNDMPQAKQVEQPMPEGQMGTPQMVTKAPTQQERMAWALRGQMNPLAAPLAQAQLAAALKGEAPYSLREGEKRFDANGNVIASNDKLPKPHEVFGRVNPHDYTPESIQKFAATGDYASLVPVRKMEVAPSGVTYNPYAVQPGQVFNDPNKLMGIDPQGQAQLNQPYFNARKDLARESATRVNVPVSVNTEKTLFGNVAEEVGKQLGQGRDQAIGARDTLLNVSQMENALKNGAIVGTGADVRTTLAQIGETLGVAGKDNAEKLANTRLAVQSMAKNELATAQQMKGQGQVSDAERRLIARAASGDQSMTAPELMALSGALRKTANYRIQAHNANVEKLRQNPNSAVLAPYMMVEPPQISPQAAPQAAPQRSLDDLLKKYGQ